MNVYEVNLLSWKMHENGDFYTYRELATELVDYVKTVIPTASITAEADTDEEDARGKECLKSSVVI